MCYNVGNRSARFNIVGDELDFFLTALTFVYSTPLAESVFVEVCTEPGHRNW